MRKHLVAWVATAGLATALGLVSTATPALAASCFEASCDGKALGGTDCGGTSALNWDSLVSGDVSIQLMYSPGCHSFWGEMQVANGGAAGALWAIPQYGGTETALETGQSSGTGLETHMWNSAGHSVKMCWGQNFAGDVGDPSANTVIGGCTQWR